MSRSSVIKWIREGKIKGVEVNGRWRIPYSEVERLLSSERVKQVAIYTRVSSNTQKDDLERQLNALKEWVKRTFGKASVIEIKDIGFWIERRWERFKETLRMTLYSQRACQLLGRSYTRGFTITIRRSTFSYLLGLLKVLTLLQVGLLRASEKGGRKG
jgi:Predicted site-specific integrase-resolvase